jgi:hypothetical protein
MIQAELHAVHVAAYHGRRVPMPGHVRVAFHRAIELARAAGVSFQPREVSVWTYTGRPEEPSVTFWDHRPVDVYLNIAIPFRTEADRVEQIVHELAHAHFDARDYLGYVQSEDRAYAFAARAMQGWRW